MEREAEKLHAVAVEFTGEEMRILGGLARLRGRSAGELVRQALGFPPLPPPGEPVPHARRRAEGAPRAGQAALTLVSPAGAREDDVPAGRSTDRVAVTPQSGDRPPPGPQAGARGR
ncbi:MAG TPA: hypothetical protein VHU13_04820 [Solirubrobacteraceae bacterium]|nr:hypothetical protein [Solirubrobacteraceae bacterium]